MIVNYPHKKIGKTRRNVAIRVCPHKRVENPEEMRGINDDLSTKKSRNPKRSVDINVYPHYLYPPISQKQKR